MVYVQPFPGPGVRTQIFNARGFPAWTKGGKEIIIADLKTVWSVAVEQAGKGLRFSPPQLLFSGLRRPAGTVLMSRILAVSRDGSRIYYPQAAEQPSPNAIHVSLGWDFK